MVAVQRVPHRARYKQAMSLSWAVLLAITLLFNSTILLPFFIMGIHQMTDAQIWSSGIDISWHPYYQGMRESLYVRALPVIVGWSVIGVPLLVMLCAELLVQWRRRALNANLTRVVLMLVPFATLVLCRLFGAKIITWVLD